VNAFVQGVDMFSSNPTARILPPEFILFGITKEQFNPWTPVDSITCIKMMGFNLTWNWSNDLLREAFR
jgi:acyl-homoserine lactone acylase PvdQ